MNKKRQPESPREYLEPFLRRYRRLFWLDGVLAVLHLPLLAWLLARPSVFANIPIRVGWPTMVVHLSLAVFGVAANMLLLRGHAAGPAMGYGKSAYAVGMRLLIAYVSVQRFSLSWDFMPEAAGPLLITLLVLIGYQSLYACCIHLNSKWSEQLRMTETTDNNILRISKPPLRYGFENG